MPEKRTTLGPRAGARLKLVRKGEGVPPSSEQAFPAWRASVYRLWIFCRRLPNRSEDGREPARPPAPIGCEESRSSAVRGLGQEPPEAAVCGRAPAQEVRRCGALGPWIVAARSVHSGGLSTPSDATCPNERPASSGCRPQGGAKEQPRPPGAGSAARGRRGRRGGGVGAL